MRAAYIERPGPPEEIRYGRLAVPEWGPHDVLVDVTATTVDPVDTLVRSGVFRTPMRFPFIVGRDLVGAVAAAGAGAPGFAAGDAVWCNSLGHGGRQGAAAEQAAVPADRLYRVPEGVDPADAVACAHPAATAYLALFQHGRLSAGEHVVVSGAAGNVGSAAVVLAAEAGARVVATAAARDARYCRSLGAAEVFDYADPQLVPRIRAACPNGVGIYLDTSGRNDLTSAVDLLAFRGRIVVFAGPQSRPVLPTGSLYTKDGAVLGFAISHASISELAEAATAVNRLLASGALRPRAVETFPLSAVAEVHLRMEQGLLSGKRPVIRPDPDD